MRLLNDRYCAVECLFQSTHLHEVRRANMVYTLLTRKFQSTHLHEVRLHKDAILISIHLFQSTHLHEVRPYRLYPSRWPIPGFNPRTYTRCDQPVSDGRRNAYRFNPRTYTRCDLYEQAEKHLPGMFQSTHLHEVRHIVLKCRYYVGTFQSTHLHEVRR